MTRRKKYIYFLIVTAVMALMGCSTQKNTSATRWWHSFNARYNTYYNATLAYIDASLEKENGNVDNFTEQIPLYTVANKNSRELGKAGYDRAIEKCEKAIQLHSIKRRPEWKGNRRKTARDVEWLSRREYNPFLWKAWLLMGRSQFYSGRFDEAASTFAYMARLYATRPAINGRARAWLAKCYIEEGWLYDAEDVIRNQRRDSVHWRARKEWDYTMADYYLHTGDAAKAVPYLRKVIKHEGRRKQKAREWYLMGQLQASIGNNGEATKAFRRCIRLNPPYELSFNARISMSEVMGRAQSKKMIRKLNRMAHDDNNSEMLDQVYYAIGNIYLAGGDTASAISAYEKGNKLGTRNGIEKGVLLLHLGDLYWQQERFSDARRCYESAVGLLDEDRKDYKQLSERSKLLDELVPFTDAVHLQDSLQELARMDEPSRNAAIDRVIAELKKKEKEERDRQADADGQTQSDDNAQSDRNNRTAANNRRQQPAAQNASKTSAWYFYNPSAVAQGKIAFQRIWGKRDNADNWQRSNRTVVAAAGGAEELTDSAREEMASAAEREDSLKQRMDSAQNDPHKREYYLAQIPMTPEQMEASNKTLEDGLYNAGVIFKDKLNNLRLSEKMLRRLTDHYPDYEHLDEAYYHLWLLYMRKGDRTMAAHCLDNLKTKYPESQFTAVLTDPYFEENARFGTQIEDSLYTATYNAFLAGRLDEVKANAAVSAARFPDGANRDKFLFVGGMACLNDGEIKQCMTDMQQLVEKYPDSRLSEMAGMIINGVRQGRTVTGARFGLSDVWSRRDSVLADSASASRPAFNDKRDTPFQLMLVFMPDSVNSNKLLFELARYNFTGYPVRLFDIAVDDDHGLRRMRVSGFRNYDEAVQYTRQLYRQQTLVKMLAGCRAYVISDENAALIGRLSYDDYDRYYSRHFSRIVVSARPLLTEPTETVRQKEPEPEENTEQQSQLDDDNTQVDEGTVVEENNAASSGDNDSGISVPALSVQQNEESEDSGISVPTPSNQQDQENNDSGISVPAPSSSQQNEENEDSGISVPTPSSSQQNEEKEDSGISVPAPSNQQEQESDDSGISVDSGAGSNDDDNTDDGGFTISPDSQQNGNDDDGSVTIPDDSSTQKEDGSALEDEYLDLDGF